MSLTSKVGSLTVNMYCVIEYFSPERWDKICKSHKCNTSNVLQTLKTNPNGGCGWFWSMIKISFCFSLFQGYQKVLTHLLMNLPVFFFFMKLICLCTPPHRHGPKRRPVARDPFGRQGQLRHADDRWGRRVRRALRLAPRHQHGRDVSPGRWGSTGGRHLRFNNETGTLRLPINSLGPYGYTFKHDTLTLPHRCWGGSWYSHSH